MKALIQRIMIVLALLFGVGLAAVTVHVPVSKADIVDDTETGQEKAEKWALAVVMIGLVIAIAGAVFCILFPPARRLGFALIGGLLILVLAVIIAKNSEIGTTIKQITGADSVKDIFSK